MEVTGKIIQVLPLQQGVSKTGSNWQLQTYVLETIENYPRKVAFELFNRNADLYKCNIDDLVTVSFDLDSREFNGRWYTSVRAWRVDPASQANQNNSGMMPPAPNVAQPTQQVTQSVQQPVSQPMQGNTQVFTAESDETTDMPF